MRNALAIFENNISEARHLTAIHDFLSAQIHVPFPFGDLLRSQVVYAVGAFDKLIHDLVRIGMVEIYMGRRPVTPKYHSETISLAAHGALVAATMPPPELVFQDEIVRRFSTVSFQKPEAVADGLSIIWSEKQKWQKIAAVNGNSADTVRTTLSLIVSRRNAIVHEADMNPVNGTKTSISRQECADMTDFIEQCGRSIVSQL